MKTALLLTAILLVIYVCSHVVAGVMTSTYIK